MTYSIFATAPGSKKELCVFDGKSTRKDINEATKRLESAGYFCRVFKGGNTIGRLIYTTKIAYVG